MHTTGIDLLLLTVFWIISLIVVNPSGNFPLNDDWSFALTVKNLIENGNYHPTGWASMPLITNVLWGYLFTIPTGFSYDALRLSTLTMSLLGIWGTYFLARELYLPRFFGFISAWVLAFNPIYYALSNTFMTDVPFTALIIMATLFFVRYLKHGGNGSLIIATTIIVVATLSRQLAISIPIGFCVALILKKGISRQSILLGLTPLILSIGALLIFQQWLETSGKLPALYHAMSHELVYALTDIDNLFSSLVSNTLEALLYLGLFLSPLLLYIMVGIYKIHKRMAIVALVITTMLIFVVHIVGHGSFELMPLGKNILMNSGIGPLTLRDTFILKLNHVPTLPNLYWVLVTLISILGAGMLLTSLGFSGITLAKKVKFGETQYKDLASVFLLLIVVVQIAPLVLVGFFDRYLIPLTALLGLGIASTHLQMTGTQSRFHLIPVTVLLIAFSYYSICATRDYITWNRIRWAALDDLITNRHVEPKDIDGGFEFNGSHFYDPKYSHRPGKSWWWVQDDKFLIAFGPIAGYEVVNKYSYKRWLLNEVSHIFVLKKEQTIKRPTNALLVL